MQKNPISRAHLVILQLGYYCSSTYWFSRYVSQCGDNIAMPEGFNFTYFGTDYNHTDSNDRVHLGRHGNMNFISNGATSNVQSMYTWGYSMPTLPDSSSSPISCRIDCTLLVLLREATTAYQNTNADCGVYYRTMPFEGKGTDVTSDITQDTTWDLADSPVRINPSHRLSLDIC